MNLSTMKLRDLKAILKQFKSGYVGMGLKDLFLMQSIRDEIEKRGYSKWKQKLI